MNKIVEDLILISKIYGIKEFVKVEKDDYLCNVNGEDGYINKSYICGNDRIELGIYDNDELMVASFFHELGHIVEPKEKGYYNSEKDAWIIGFKLAEKHGYKFSDKTYIWSNEQLKTYEH